MKKILKIAGIGVGVCAALVVVAGVVLRVLLPPEKLKALAIAQADKSLRRKLEIGDVSLGLVSGLRVDALRLSESPDFSKGEFFKAERLVVSPEWLPLLHKELVARKVELDGASVVVVKGKDGKFNFADLTGGASAAPAPKASAAAPSAAPALAVDVLRLKNVALHYADKKQGTKADLVLGAVEVDGFKPSGPFDVSVELNADYAAAGKKYAAKLTAKGQADLGGGKPADFKLDLPKIALSSMGKQVDASLKVEGAATPKITLAAQTPALDQKFLKDATGSSVPDGVTVPPIKAAASLGYADPRLEISSLKITAAGAEISGSGSVADVNAKSPRFSLKLASNQIALSSLAQAAESMKQFGLGGNISLNLAASGDASAPKASGTLGIDGVGASYKGQTLEKVGGQVKFTQDSVDMPQLTGRVNGGDFKLKLSAGNPAAPTVTVSGTLSLLDLGALQKLSEGAPQASASNQAAPVQATAGPAKSGPPLKTLGDLTVARTTHPNFECGSANFVWNLSGVTPDMKRLAGTARFNVAPGKATNLLKLAASRGGLVKVLVVPLTGLQIAKPLLVVQGIKLPDLDNLPFSKIVGNYTMTGGVITFQQFQFDSPSLGITTTGAVDMGSQNVNLKTVLTIPSTPPLEFDTTGPLSDPKTRLNVAKAVQSVGKKILQQQLQEQGQKLLKGLFH